MQCLQVVAIFVVVWVGVFVGGLVLVIVGYFVIVCSGVVGFLVGTVVDCIVIVCFGTVVGCTVDSVVSLFFSLIITIPYQTSHFHYSQFTSFHF